MSACGMAAFAPRSYSCDPPVAAVFGRTSACRRRDMLADASCPSRTTSSTTSRMQEPFAGSSVSSTWVRERVSGAPHRGDFRLGVRGVALRSRSFGDQRPPVRARCAPSRANAIPAMPPADDSAVVAVARIRIEDDDTGDRESSYVRVDCGPGGNLSKSPPSEARARRL